MWTHFQSRLCSISVSGVWGEPFVDDGVGSFTVETNTTIRKLHWRIDKTAGQRIRGGAGSLFCKSQLTLKPWLSSAESRPALNFVFQTLNKTPAQTTRLTAVGFTGIKVSWYGLTSLPCLWPSGSYWRNKSNQNNITALKYIDICRIESKQTTMCMCSW